MWKLTLYAAAFNFRNNWKYSNILKILNLKSVFMSKSGIPEKPHLRHLRSLAPLRSHVLHQKHYWDSSSSVLLYNDLICNNVNLTFKAPVSDVTSSNVKLWNKTNWKVRQIGTFLDPLSQLLGLLPSPRAKVICFCIETYCTGSKHVQHCLGASTCRLCCPHLHSILSSLLLRKLEKNTRELELWLLLEPEWSSYCQ